MKDMILGIPRKFYAFPPNSESWCQEFGSPRVWTRPRAAYATAPRQPSTLPQPSPIQSTGRSRDGFRKCVHWLWPRVLQGEMTKGARHFKGSGISNWEGLG